jgi:hypothetical protein
MAHFHTSMYYSYYNLFVDTKVPIKPKIIINTCPSEYLYKPMIVRHVQ